MTKEELKKEILNNKELTDTEKVEALKVLEGETKKEEILLEEK